ncbi:MAG: hypothetical protein KGJ23_01715 [Euryarchaeota archaeon]|nr:hypothetical protein [Euryarchaeota archaeon]MDE1835313.1 hypothetical protein [Euryarchaeota archaeon]MDE1880584.1 hypothetical protein [Euryarchaeota archaeon]MDE2043609.1 hypothetical protein [Thermoplasmata archaeon]
MKSTSSLVAKPRGKPSSLGFGSSSWNRLFAEIFVVALVISLSWVVWGLGPHAAEAAPTPKPTPPPPPAPDYVYLAIKGGCAWCASPFNGSDQFTPANFTVPDHTEIIFTITNFDNGQNPVATPVAQVSGVVGGVEHVGASLPSSWGTAASEIPLGDVSHTFSALPQSTTSGWNVPLHESDGPSGWSTTFALYFNTTGPVLWECQAPCDGWSMGQPGFMSGTITVT